jgi:hypothetical protein
VLRGLYRLLLKFLLILSTFFPCLLVLLRLVKLRVSQLVELKSSPVLLSDIFNIVQAGEIVNQVEHFLIIWIVIEGNNWDTVVYLEGKGIDGIVDDHHIL